MCYSLPRLATDSVKTAHYPPSTKLMIRNGSDYNILSTPIVAKITCTPAVVCVSPVLRPPPSSPHTRFVNNTPIRACWMDV